MKHYYNVKNYARTPEIQELPSLIDIQLKSFEDFLYGGRLLELFDEINPIQSFNGNLSLYFPGNIQGSMDLDLKLNFEDPKYSPDECIERDLSYAAPLYAQVALVNHEAGDEIIQQDIFLGEFPLMTEKGTFIINGTERVVVSQLIRSPGVYFDAEEERATGRSLANAKLIPDRGAWMEFETRKTDYITIKFNRKRTIPVTVLLRALAAVEDGLPARLSPIKTGEDAEIRALFADVDNNETHRYIESCFKNEPAWEAQQKKYRTKSTGQTALVEFFSKMRPGDPTTLDNAKEYLEGQLFDQRRYDLERVGRYKLNQRLGHGDAIELSHRTICKADIVKLVEQMILINNGARAKDDIDHLGNRRVKTVGELIGNKLRIGLRRMERVVKERMSIREAEQLTPISLVNIRPIVAAVREFFGSSQLSQFMEQTNPLSELTHKRTLSALGPGGLRRERAGFDVRDVHHSHYGRICPIETPEGPNIGLIGRLASYARVNDLGFIETPYRKVVSKMDVDDPDLLGRALDEDVEAELRLERDTTIDASLLERMRLFGAAVGTIPTLAENDDLNAAYARIAELSQAEALDETQRDFDAFVDSVKEYAELDKQIYELRLKPEPESTMKPVSPELVGETASEDVVVQTGDPEMQASIELVMRHLKSETMQDSRAAFEALLNELAGDFAIELNDAKKALDAYMESGNEDLSRFSAFVDGTPGIAQRVSAVASDYAAERNASQGALAQLLALDDLPDMEREALIKRSSCWDRLHKDTENFVAQLEKFAGALSDRMPGSQVARSRRRTYVKAFTDLTNYQQGRPRTEALRHDDGMTEILDALLENGVAARELTIAEQGDKIDQDAVKLLQDHGVSEVSVVVPPDYGAIGQFLDLYERRTGDVAQAHEHYEQARTGLLDAVTLLAALPKATADHRDAARRYRAALESLRQERDDFARHFANLKSAIAEMANLNGADPPKRLRDRVTRWGKDVVNHPQILSKVQSDNNEAHLALLALVNKASSEEIIRERPVADELLGERIGRSVTVETVVLDEGLVFDEEARDLLRRFGIREVPVQPFATRDITYLSADDEDTYIIAQANAKLDERGQFVNRRVSARFDQGFLTVPPQRIEYMDIAPRQIVGISAALIPFLSHDAANRALMGSNMQRQAVPLITPDVSVVSTGMEGQAAFDSGQVLVSEIDAEVISVQGHRVIARTPDGDEKTFHLRKYERSNQSTCIDQRPLVRKGDTLKPGDVIADSSSTYNGQLALGHDVLTCFLSWDGGNYEDALLVSEDMLRTDKFTSIHIEKHEIEARDTKLGAEEITYDIPNVGEEALKDLDEHGIVRIGAEVGPNDILVGKITPKGEKELSPEEKLLRAIFGEQAREVKDSSLRLPHGDRGKVIDVKVFTRDEHPDLSAGVEKMVRVSVAQRRKLTVGDKMAGRHGNKGVISKIVTVEDMPYIEGGVPVEIILNPLGVPSRMNIGQILELHLGWAADRLGFRAITPVFDGVKEQEIQAELGRAWLIDWAWRLTTLRAWESQARLAEIAGIAPEDFDDDMHVICAFLFDQVNDSGLYDNEAIILERDEIYVRRVAVAEMLREYGYDPDSIMVYDNSELTLEERDKRDAKAVDVSIRLWIGRHAPEEIELADDPSTRELFDIANRVMFETGIPVPHYGKQTLYDGRTGEPFDRHVAVGYVHMLKLAHLVEDKAHARSTGPYSLVTQQPLGGKAQFGGQRFGEMEVWALEAYGAAHILQEMLTVKSDDVQGRVKTYESIVKGEPIEEPGIPTSFRVLVKELQSLGLSVEAITGSGDVIRFGKYDEQTRKPQPETGLLGLGAG